MASGKTGRSNMKVITVNVPESYLESIKILLSLEDGLFPSRSELIRVAVRNALLIDMSLVIPSPIVEEYDEENFVRVPIESGDGVVREFKQYKIIRRLEY